MTLQQLLPTPWCPEQLYERTSDIGANFIALGPGNANAAIYCPVLFPAAVTITTISFRPTNATGNYDLGIYTRDWTRLASTGSTAMSDAQVNLTLSYRIGAGQIVWAALVLSSTSGRFLGRSMSATRAVVGAGCGEEASALPLPATATPVTPTSWTHIPVFTFGVR